MKFSSELLKDVRLGMRTGYTFRGLKRFLRLRKDETVREAIRQAFEGWVSIGEEC